MKVIIGAISKILGVDDEAAPIINLFYHFSKAKNEDNENFVEKYGKILFSAAVIILVVIANCIKK